MRRAAHVDANQKAIVEALRKAGASVQSLAAVGKGVPDLLVGWRGRNVLMECKNGEKLNGNKLMTDDQEVWIKRWTGQVVVVLTPQEAVAALHVLEAA